MRRLLFPLLAAAALACMAAVPNQANAAWRWGWRGPVYYNYYSSPAVYGAYYGSDYYSPSYYTAPTYGYYTAPTYSYYVAPSYWTGPRYYGWNGRYGRWRGRWR